MPLAKRGIRDYRIRFAGNPRSPLIKKVQIFAG